MNVSSYNLYYYHLSFLIQALVFQGVGGREAVWQRRYFCVVGPVLYMLETPESKTYKQYFRFGLDKLISHSS